MNEEKEVYFDQYCKSCKHHGLEESKDPCPHMPGLEEQVAMAHKLRKEIEKNG